MILQDFGAGHAAAEPAQDMFDGEWKVGLLHLPAGKHDGWLLASAPGLQQIAISWGHR